MGVIVIPVTAINIPTEKDDDCGCKSTENSKIEKIIEKVESTTTTSIYNGGVVTIKTLDGKTYHISSTYDEISQINLYTVTNGDGELIDIPLDVWGCTYDCIMDAYAHNWFIQFFCGSICGACLATAVVPPAWPAVPVICLMCGCCLGGSALGCLIICFLEGE